MSSPFWQLAVLAAFLRSTVDVCLSRDCVDSRGWFLGQRVPRSRCPSKLQCDRGCEHCVLRVSLAISFRQQGPCCTRGRDGSRAVDLL